MNEPLERSPRPAAACRGLVWAWSLAGCGPASTSGTEPAAGSEAVAPAMVAEPAAEPAPAPTPDRVVVIAPGASSGLVAFAETTPAGATAWVGPLPGNGGRDAMIYLPPGGSERPLRLVYHFHGTYAEHVEAPREDLPKKRWVGWDRVRQVVDAAAPLQSARDWDVAIVYPLSAGPRHEPGAKGMGNKAYDRMWMVDDAKNGFRDSFDGLDAQVRAVLREQLRVEASRIVARVLVEGHSAGGIALRNIALAGTQRVGDYLFLDASFQGWADGCHAALQKSGSDARITIVMTDNGIADPYGRRDPWCVTMPEDARAFATQEKWCKDRPTEKPAGSDKTCETLALAAKAWPEAEAWCADYPQDLKNMAGVTLHRTSVYHGEQPRHFVGGLELPESLPLRRD